MEKNVPLARKVLEHIEADPTQWDQSWWLNSAGAELPVDIHTIETSDTAMCNTTACFAGHTLLMTGKAMIRVSRGVHGTGRLPGAALVGTATGEVLSDSAIIGMAADALGLSCDDARDIFYATYITTTQDLRANVESVMGEKL